MLPSIEKSNTGTCTFMIMRSRMDSRASHSGNASAARYSGAGMDADAMMKRLNSSAISASTSLRSVW